MTVVQAPCSYDSSVLYVEGRLCAPFTGVLRHRVRALVRRGARDIVLNLAGVSRIDAAGVGELVRAFNVTRAADAACRIVESGPWVREILQRVGLFDRLSGHAEWRQAPQAPKGRGGPSPAGPRLAWSNGARVAAAGN